MTGQCSARSWHCCSWFVTFSDATNISTHGLLFSQFLSNCQCSLSSLDIYPHSESSVGGVRG